jgi:hypothetical protein
MERNWLIRTYNKQILGPVSKQKLLEFIQKGSIGITDEVTSGNGYWFSLKEKDLIDKYLNGDIPQSFNPVSESKSVLVFKKNLEKTTSLNSSPPNNRITDRPPLERAVLPPVEDLEYPDMGAVAETRTESPDITIIARMPTAPEIVKPKIKAAKIEVAPPADSSDQLFPQSDDLEYPDMQGESNEKEDTQPDRDFTVILPPPQIAKTHKEEVVEAKKELKLEVAQIEKPKPIENKVKLSPKPKPQNVEKLNKPTPAAPRAVPKELEKRNDNYLFVLFFVLIVILFGIFYYYREILNKPLPL